MVKNLPKMWETQLWTLGSGRSPGEGKGYPLQDSCLENSMAIDAWKILETLLPKSCCPQQACSSAFEAHKACLSLLSTHLSTPCPECPLSHPQWILIESHGLQKHCPWLARQHVELPSSCSSCSALVGTWTPDSVAVEWYVHFVLSYWENCGPEKLWLL